MWSNTYSKGVERMTISNGIILASMINALTANPYQDSKQQEEQPPRPYLSDNKNVEKILDKYYKENGIPDCDSTGKEMIIPDGDYSYRITIEAICLPGGEEYRLKIRKKNHVTEEIFIDANLDGRLDNDPMFMSIPDEYVSKDRKGKKEYNMHYTPESKWPKINQRYKEARNRLVALLYVDQYSKQKVAALKKPQKSARKR